MVTPRSARRRRGTFLIPRWAGRTACHYPCRRCGCSSEIQRFKDPASEYVFPGSKRGSVISAATLRKMLIDMGHGGEITTHGMRATFRTWASETTHYDKDVIEACLAHAQGELDLAYHRGSYLAKRRLLMAAWAEYCDGRTTMFGAEVISLRA